MQTVHQQGPLPKQLNQRSRPRRPVKLKPEGEGLANPEAGPGPSTTQANANKPSKANKPRRPRDAKQGGTSKPQVEGSTTADRPASKAQKSAHSRNKHPGGKASAPHIEVEAVSVGGDASSTSVPVRKPRRATKFNANLTENQPKPGERVQTPAKRYRNTAPKGDDLTSRLIHELSTSPYPDCLICFLPMHRDQPTWSCSPLIPISSVTDDDERDKNNTKETRSVETAQCCWTTFHLKCIRPWASKNVKELEEAWRNRGIERRGEWRCPGCQSKRLAVPTSYW